jgi:hypothetical protein
MEYAHGGLTLQEALTPFLTVTPRKGAGGQTVQIESLRWVGLRLYVQLAGNIAGVLVDLRTRAGDEASSILPAEQRAKPPDETAKASVVVTDDSRLGEAAILVVLHAGQVIAKQSTTVGGD